MEQVRELLVEKRWALLNIEFIRTSCSHGCIRKLYILEQNGYTDMESDFYPWKRYNELDWKYQRSFQYCLRKVHKLSYDPRNYSPECRLILPLLNEFIVDSGIELILHKGGDIERNLCKELWIPSLNIECIEGLEKSTFHDPRTK